MKQQMISVPQGAGEFVATLRPYQRDAIDSVFRWFDTNTSNPLIVVPTGGGKSIIQAGLIHEILTQFPRERIVCVTHVRELVAQNHAALLRAWPGADAGIYSAGLRRREHDAHILFCGIQSVFNKAAKVGWADLVIIDEAHRIPADGMGMYRTFLDSLRSMNSGLRMIGLTATPFRTGEGRLDKGEGAMFGGVAYECDLTKLIDDGYLSRVRNKGTANAINTEGVAIRGGEFVEGQLERAAMAGDSVERSVAEIVSRAADRKAWLLFCCGIAHAEAVHAELVKSGVDAACVFGHSTDRDLVIESYKAGKLRCIVSVGVLTTGFDAPNTDMIALLRPTMSPVLYVQMVGRGLRVAPGKTDCLLLDFGKNILRHGPINAVDPGQKKKAKNPSEDDEDDETVLAKECPNCLELVLKTCDRCPACDYEWPKSYVDKTTDEPDEDRDVITDAPKKSSIERWDVTYQSARFHAGKNGKPQTFCVEYEGGFGRRVREWICFDHPVGSFPHRKAVSWWKSRTKTPEHPAPASVDEAMVRWQAGELRKVASLVVYDGGEWPEIRGVTLQPDREPGSDDGDESLSSVTLPSLPEIDLPF